MIKQSSVDFLTENVYIADIYYSDHISITKSYIYIKYLGE
jgi:hypothetical protein